MVHKTAKEYRELLERMLMAAGADEANARCVAAHLVASELAGVETHGVRPMEHYIQSIESGELKPAARPPISLLLRLHTVTFHKLQRKSAEKVEAGGELTPVSPAGA